VRARDGVREQPADGSIPVRDRERTVGAQAAGDRQAGGVDQLVVECVLE
jgi:hypothetical protein